MTFAGAQNPVLSDDGTKVAFGVPLSDKASSDKVGIWVMDLGDLPIGFSKDPRRATNADPTGLSWAWSPDSRGLLVRGSNQSYYLLEVGSETPLTSLTPLTSPTLAKTLSGWAEESDKKYKDKFNEIPKKLQEILTSNRVRSKRVAFSPDKKKFLFTASSDFEIPSDLTSPLPGSSTQKEERLVKKGNTYVYDLKEDKNFLVYSGSLPETKSFLEEASAAASTKSQAPSNKQTLNTKYQILNTSVHWFPTSNHLILAEANKVTIVDYDGTNPQLVWNGPYEAPYAIPSPNTSRLLILTNLGAGEEVVGNLYALSLK